MERSARYVLSFAIFVAAISCGKRSSSTTDANPAGPVGAAISFSSVTATGMTLSWGAATDSDTPQASLKYKTVYSASNNISTVTTAEANGTLLMDWTANTLTTPANGLSNETTYYFAVLIQDNAGLIAIQTASKATLCSGKMIYLADVSWGAFGGKAGADAACDSQKPATLSGSAKAMIYDGGGGRIPCSGIDCTSSNAGQIDWPVAASTNYCTTNYVQTMGSSNAFGYLDVTLANSLYPSRTFTYTGLGGLYAGQDNTSNDCNDWTIGDDTGLANSGSANDTGTDFYSHSQIFCATPGSVYCVEQ